MASLSSSFCTVPVVTNMIGPEEMTLMKYMFLVFFMGQCIWRAIRLLLLQSVRKLKKYFWQLKSKCFEVFAKTQPIAVFE